MNKNPHPRELAPYYIGATEKDINEMLLDLGLKDLKELYSHIDENNLFDKEMNIPTHLEMSELKAHLIELSNKNKKNINFLGGGLQDFKIPSVVAKVCDIRGLTTAYTPYQPERSQGTLQTLWIYQSAMSKITGFEAINASMYERATCLFEALNCATRIVKNSSTVIVCDNIYPKDKEVLDTQAAHTKLKIKYAAIDKKTGLTDLVALKKLIAETPELAAIAIPQINAFGSIENFDELTDIAKTHKLLAIAIIDPIALANSGLKEPAAWGSAALGADILVGEGQHLVLAPNFGGPGLGIFGIRYNEENKTNIRQTAGRFIGKTVDEVGDEARAIILSTREQHIRREKATSNICSNQSFIASACGAALLQQGSTGLEEAFNKAHANALMASLELSKIDGVSLRFKQAFFNEFTISLPISTAELIKKANQMGLNIGIDVSERCGLNENLLLISLSDKHEKEHIEKLISFFKTNISGLKDVERIPEIRENQKRKNTYFIPSFSESELVSYYEKLGKQNLSPDDGIYPLGSCTMKYNPEVNDWAANLPGFTHTHPEAPLEDAQGSLELLYEIQNWFKEITGLAAVTTQPVAGAQGELVGLKMFQAYHKDHSKTPRDIVIIPRSAHGTNPATASMAGYETKKVAGIDYGIVTISANDNGEMNFSELEELVQKYGERISCVMVTNPNTAGIFETKFKKMSDLIHSVGGLVYMDGANMNAIAGWVDLKKLGVDAVHNNLHKTWSIPHGGGGPGDAIVAVSEKLVDYLPGVQIERENENFVIKTPTKSIGSFHRHFGNFAHKVRAYTYLRALGRDGIKKMSAVAVLSARYLFHNLKETYPSLPLGAQNTPRMHEFIITLSEDTFKKIAEAGTPKANAISRVGKLFLDFGFHAPTVAFPEVYGLMVEPTETYSKSELDGFTEVIKTISQMINECPEILTTVPHFTPVLKVDEVLANKNVILSEELFKTLPLVKSDRIDANKLRNMKSTEIISQIMQAHKERAQI